MTAKGRYVAAVCPYCKTRQAIDAVALCREKVVVLGEQRLKVRCSNPKCGREFTVTIDCSEYQ